MLKHRLVFIGTYTEPILFGTGKIFQGKGDGIYVYRFDESSGSMELCNIEPVGPNPSYLTFDLWHRFLYTVNELKEFEGTPGGAVSAFSVDPSNGKLTLLNRQSSHGTDPCQLIVDKTGKFVLVANFGSGSVSVFPIQRDGSLGDPTDVVQHRGSSADPIRQTGPHAHSITMDAAGLFAFVPDLGLDKVMVYKFDATRGKLEPNSEPWVEIPPGSGPRQLVIHPRGKFAYLINELSSTVMAFQYEEEQGILRKIQTISTLPGDFKGASACGELQITPSGKHLYASNRGHDSIVSYAINQTDGTLAYIGWQSTDGKTPRHFMIDPGNEFLLTANQDTDNVVTFSLDPETGALSTAGKSISVPSPVCIKFL